MINWTIGQLGLGEAPVLGMSPQGMGKDKGGSARVEADLLFTLTFFAEFSGDFERKSDGHSFTK